MPYMFPDEFWNDDPPHGGPVLVTEEAVQDKLRRYLPVLEQLDTNLTGCRATIRLVEMKGWHKEHVVHLVAACEQAVQGTVHTDSRWSARHSAIYLEVALRVLPGLVARQVAEMIPVQTECPASTRQHSLRKYTSPCQSQAVNG